MMAIYNRVYPLPLYFFDSVGFDGLHWNILRPPLEKAVFYIRISNNSTDNIFVSYDGVTLHDYIITGGVLELNLQANNTPRSNVALLAENSSIWVNGPALTTGYIYCSALTSFAP